MPMLRELLIINVDGVCAVSVSPDGVGVDSQLMAGVIAAIQRFWAEVTGEVPTTITLESSEIAIKRFTTGKRDWFLVLIMDPEGKSSIPSVENAVLSVVSKWKTFFEEFNGELSAINKLKKEFVMALSKIPCPRMNKCVFRGKFWKPEACSVIAPCPYIDKKKWARRIEFYSAVIMPNAYKILTVSKEGTPLRPGMTVAEALEKLKGNEEELLVMIEKGLVKLVKNVDGMQLATSKM
ncbi:MAG: hypothetical protein ACTSWP_06790 [Candidatus Freyarchaeota archaeon]|nr:hypothetical protein [Candidatus Freyrarchaeum guaymaensis]